MKKIYFCLLILLTGLLAVSCSKDDDGPSENNSSSLKIDDKEIERVLSAVCEEVKLNGEEWLNFSAIFMYEGDMITFSTEAVFSSPDQLKAGEDITDDFEVTRLYVMSGNGNSGIGSDGSSNSRFYSIEGGSVMVNSVSGSKVTLQYKNLVISKENGNSHKSFTLSGTLNYDMN